MVEHIGHTYKTNGCLSEQEKVRYGLDIASFSRRMDERLRKVRGENTESSDTFLVRHHYYKKANSIA